MHRKGCFHHPGSVAFAHRSAVGNSAHRFVLVKRVRGQLKCSRPINDTPLRIAFRSLEATP